MADPTVKVGVFADASQLKRELDRAQGHVSSFSNEAKRSGDILRDVLFGGAVIYGAKKVIDAASDLEQAIGGTGAVFGEASVKVDQFAKEAAQLAGLSESTARTLTSRLGASLTGFGLSAEEAADKSVYLAQVGADLAATMGGSASDAVAALGAAFRGEFDPLERFGIALKQSEINTKAVAMGLADSESDVSSYARGQAALALITERSAFAQGQFARESDTAAGAAAIAAAEMQNASADLGRSFLPIYTKVAEVVGAVASAFGSLPDWVQTGVVALGGAALVGPKLAEATLGVVNAVKQLPAAFDKAAVKAYDAAGSLDNLTTKHAKLLDSLAGVGIVVAGAVAAYQIYQDAIRSTDDEIENMVGSIRDSAKSASYSELTEKIEALRAKSAEFDRERASSKNPFDADYRDQLIRGANALDRLREKLGGVATVTETVALITGDSTDDVLKWIRAQEDAGITYDDAKVALAAYTGEIEGNGLSTEDATEAQNGFAESIKKAADEQRAAIDPFFAAVSALTALKDAQAESARVGSDQAATLAEQEAASIKAAEAAVRFDATLLALAKSSYEAGGGIDAVKATLERLVAQGLITREDADRTIAKFQEVGTSAANNLYDRGFRVTADTTQAVGAIDDLKRRIVEMGNAAAGANPVFSAGDVSRFTSGGVNFDGTQNRDNNPATGGGRAMGGDIMPGKWYRAGERGPEWIKADSGGRVFNATESKQLQSGDNVTFNITGVRDPIEAANEAVRLRRKQVYLAGQR